MVQFSTIKFGSEQVWTSTVRVGTITVKYGYGNVQYGYGTIRLRYGTRTNSLKVLYIKFIKFKLIVD